MKIGNHTTHELADAFPLMEGADLAGLVDDIKANGQRDDIVLIGESIESGIILDGRNRYRACLIAKVEPRFRLFSEGDPSAFVVSMNLARRDLDAWDRAATAQRLVALIKRVTKKRAKQQPRLPGVTEETEEMAASVTLDGVPELVEALDAKVLDLPAAAALSRLEPELQVRAIEKLKQAAASPPKPVRARAAYEGIAYDAGELSPTDIAGLVTLCRIGDKSVHAEAGHGASVLRRMVPGMVRG